MTELNYTVESLDGIDDAAKPFYAEAEGGKGYVLKVQGVVPKSAFDELNQKQVDAADEAGRRRRANENLLKALGVEKMEDAQSAIEAMKAGKGKGAAEQEEILRQVKDAAQKDVAEWQGKYKGLLSKSAAAELKAAILAANFHPEIAEDIATTAMNRVQLDDDGNIRILKADLTGPLAGSGAGGMATFADLAKELAAAKPSFLVDGGKGGGGKPPASGGGNTAGKTITRSQFDAMTHPARAEFAKSGGKVVDG